MESRFKKIGSIFFCVSFFLLNSYGQECNIELSNDDLKIVWKKDNGQWVMDEFSALKEDKMFSFGNADGKYSVIYSQTQPSKVPLTLIENGDTLDFPGVSFNYVHPKFQRGISEVPMNRAGIIESFYPQSAFQEDGRVIFSSTTAYGDYSAIWSLSNENTSEVHVSIIFKAGVEGYYSLPSVSCTTMEKEKVGWCGIPGYFMGDKIQSSLPLSYAYGHGLPEYPIICRESTISTMISFLSDKNDLCFSVIPAPEHNANPYTENTHTHDKIWNIGLAHMNRDGAFIPTAYHPVLGENKSFLKQGDSICFNYTLRLKAESWYDSYRHTIYNHYKFNDFLSFKKTEMSLSERLLKLYIYILDEQKSMWNREFYNGKTIAAQSYHSGVTGAQNDAIKNSDIGALWMLSKLTDDNRLSHNLLPYVRNFKIGQQVDTGFFKGAVKGQYYLTKSKKFTEEWGNQVEPTAVTYYTMMDIGNILLFEDNNDKELKQLLKNGADRLLEWQKEDGSWDIAYDMTTHERLFSDLHDFRPTFYGQMIAYEILEDSIYLESALKGADWLLKNAVDKLNFVGVCGDVRFVNDFSTAQCAMAFLDLYKLTLDKKYLDAAIKIGQYYTTSIYTHPIPNNELKTINDKVFYDWQLSKCGLGFEHGGVMGSAVDHGPILLASHCGLFITLFSHTKDSLFLDMARAAALGRDAFVNPETSVVSYYWTRFNRGAGPFPHHAIWQIGWIYDYLVSEAEVRSQGEISFPRGFMTPKVGPHKSLGFAPGVINGVKSNLIIKEGLIEIDNPNIDYITAMSEDGQTLFVVLLNQQTKSNSCTVRVFNKTNHSKKIKMDIQGFGQKIIKI